LEKPPELVENKTEGRLESAMLAGTVGKRILALRQRYGLSQRELARRADMTNSSLSTIEQGKVSPSIASLEKILNAIPISLQSFFSENVTHSPPVIRQHELMLVKKEGLENTVLPLSEHGKQDAYIARQVYAPGARIHSEWMIRQGFVGGLVIEGQLTLNLEGTEYRLAKGDGFHFALHRTHSFKNEAGCECVVVSVSLTH
jgi:transcriptional regulator with XRE-family HTH domain